MSIPAKTLIEMIRMTPDELHVYLEPLWLLQIRAGYEWFIAHGLVRESPGEAAAVATQTNGHTPTLTGDELREFRLSLRLTQVQLAEVLGVRNTLISEWENGHVAIPPTYVTMLRTLSEAAIQKEED